jgi:hypothetical protein
MPPQQSQCDHGVSGPSHWLLDEELAGQSHWLLDEELSSLGNRRGKGRPAALRHEAIQVPTATAAATVAEPPRGNFLMLVAGLVPALLVYALLSSTAVVGALEEVHPGVGHDPVWISATMKEPGARELAELRWLVALTPGATIERPLAPNGPGSSGRPKAPAGPNAGPDDGVSPLPPPAPRAVIPETPPPRELPGVEVPPLPRVEAPELRGLPKLSELP